MKILSFSYSHEANASLLIDGLIVASAAEERFTKIKGESGYPKQAIEFCLNYAKIKAIDLDKVIIVSENDPPRDYIVNRTSSFSVDDYVKEQELYWKPKLYEGKNPNYLEIFKDKIIKKNFNFKEILKIKDDENLSKDTFRKLRIQTVVNHLKIDEKIVEHIKHELGHQFYSIFCQDITDDTIVLTCEGMGDYSSNTVSTYANNEFTELYASTDNHLAKLYKYITLILGMKPDMHEYKVMGLAPYANEYEIKKAYPIFKDIFKVNNLGIIFNNKPKDMYFYFKENLQSCRFDGIAGALQKVSEEILIEWINNCIKVIGKKDIVFSGGVAQNIKAAMHISEISDLNNIYIGPSPGDGSLSVGGCYYSFYKFLKDKKEQNIKSKIKPISNVYLGPEYTDSEIETCINSYKIKNFEVIKNYKIDDLVNYLVKDNVVARFSGRMELGQRSLGNRSIISSPINYSVVKKINSKIKFRDFWMPFTPTILKEYEKKYIKNSKNLHSPFMTMAFDSTEEFIKIAPAAIHPADNTCRPQILERSNNANYYDLIKSFGDKTGTYSLLNTSLNLHGMPMVCSPEDAMYTFLNSGLDILAFDNFLLIKK